MPIKRQGCYPQPVITHNNIQPLASTDPLKSDINLLKKLVEIPSSSRNIRGVRQVHDLLASELKSLGFNIQLIKSEEQNFAELLLATKNNNSQQTINLVMHSDTVSEGIDGVPSFHLNEQSQIAIGSGVADDKAGIVIALRGLKQFLSINEPNFNIQLICSPNEEVGSLGFWSFFKTFNCPSSICLGFEPSLEDGHVISSRFGNRWYELTIKGREAHSGRANGEELNAAHEFAYKLVKILALKELYPEVKINIGAIASDKDVFNIVCGRVKAKIDLRFKSNHDRDSIDLAMKDIFNTHTLKTKFGAIPLVDWQIVDDCPSFLNSQTSLEFIEHYTNYVSKIEKKIITHQHSGGASDLNHIAANCAIALDGLGAVGGRIHTNQEYIHVDSLSTRSQALSFFLTQINQNTQGYASGKKDSKKNIQGVTHYDFTER